MAQGAVQDADSPFLELLLLVMTEHLRQSTDRGPFKFFLLVPS